MKSLFDIHMWRPTEGTQLRDIEPTWGISVRNRSRVCRRRHLDLTPSLRKQADQKRCQFLNGTRGRGVGNEVAPRRRLPSAGFGTERPRRPRGSSKDAPQRHRCEAQCRGDQRLHKRTARRPGRRLFASQVHTYGPAGDSRMQPELTRPARAHRFSHALRLSIAGIGIQRVHHADDPLMDHRIVSRHDSVNGAATKQQKAFTSCAVGVLQ